MTVLTRARALAGLAIAATAAPLLLTSGAHAAVTSGTWEAYPGSATVYTATVQQPLNADGSSNFKAAKGVIPVKFALAQNTGPFAFQSIGSDSDPSNDYSYVSFTPATTTTLSQITNLSASYTFTQGNCHGGSLRWQVRVSSSEAIYLYYGDPPSFTDCTTSNQSDLNLTATDDLRVDTTQLVGGTFYDSWAHALQLAGGRSVLRASLVLDSGWGGDQVVTLSSASVNDNTFTPPAATTPASTCALPQASIRVTKTSSSTSGVVNETETIQPNDDNGLFRVVDCKEMYNLAVSSLSGTGHYKAEIVVAGATAGAAEFDLR